MTRFLDDLREFGRVRVAAGTALVHDREDLRQLDAADRQHAPGPLPTLNVAAAGWGAELLHRACVLLIERHLPEAAAVFPDDGPNPADPAAVHAVDLTLRHLPELHRLAHAAAPDDPLVAALRGLAARWPLSSVGVPLPEGLAPRLDGVWSHPTLRRVYVDRVLARADRSRLADPHVRGAVAAAVGDFPELLPFPDFLRLEVS